jgi:hypothetical protein
MRKRRRRHCWYDVIRSGETDFSLTDKVLDKLISEEANGDDDVLNLILQAEIDKRQLASVDKVME